MPYASLLIGCISRTLKSNIDFKMTVVVICSISATMKDRINGERVYKLEITFPLVVSDKQTTGSTYNLPSVNVKP